MQAGNGCTCRFYIAATTVTNRNLALAPLADKLPHGSFNVGK